MVTTDIELKPEKPPAAAFPAWLTAKLVHPTAKRSTTNGCSFTQVLGAEGSGTRRSVLELIPPGKKVVWLASEWRIYAPLLWTLAQKKQLQLLGIECAERKRWRNLWRELYEAKAFEVWVIDHLHLKNAEGFFLKQLLQNLNVQVFVLEDRVHAFCEKRVRIQLQHHEHSLNWQKGALNSGGKNNFIPHTQSIPASYLQSIREELCSGF